MRKITREELIRQCRYYKGEDKNLYEEEDNNKNMLWFYEYCWVEIVLRGDIHLLDDCVGDYTAYGLGLFVMYDDTPVSLKALLFNRYAKGEYSMADAVEHFKRFYRKYYA